MCEEIRADKLRELGFRRMRTWYSIRGDLYRDPYRAVLLDKDIYCWDMRMNAIVNEPRTSAHGTGGWIRLYYRTRDAPEEYPRYMVIAEYPIQDPRTRDRYTEVYYTDSQVDALRACGEALQRVAHAWEMWHRMIDADDWEGEAERTRVRYCGVYTYPLDGYERTLRSAEIAGHYICVAEQVDEERLRRGWPRYIVLVQDLSGGGDTVYYTDDLEDALAEYEDMADELRIDAEAGEDEDEGEEDEE